MSLRTAWQRADSLLCVGLDPDPQRLPAQHAGRADAIYEFCRDIVDATGDLVCAFKPQIAYFSAARAEDQLEALIAHIHRRWPGVPVILDAKRGDIGATGAQYAREVFERYAADAVTLSPFMGFDSIQPFLEHRGRGALLLCRTSNPGGGDLQSLQIDGQPLYEHIARLAVERWNDSGQVGLVVGATYPAELARVRAIAPEMPLLVPGIGAQGGDIDATVQAGRDAAGVGLVVNSARAILYASSGDDYAAAAREAAIEARDAINRARR
ncbi:MAG TPA: orotidine-5'-phosphate decarboxylase [Burkholderiaceae bacterium]|nr:orotidine-5'-phosphate decarboxylase [Burkholderiaceae bacterium]